MLHQQYSKIHKLKHKTIKRCDNEIRRRSTEAKRTNQKSLLSTGSYQVSNKPKPPPKPKFLEKTTNQKKTVIQDNKFIFNRNNNGTLQNNNPNNFQKTRTKYWLLSQDNNAETSSNVVRSNDGLVKPRVLSYEKLIKSAENNTPKFDVPIKRSNSGKRRAGNLLSYVKTKWSKPNDYDNTAYGVKVDDNVLAQIIVDNANFYAASMTNIVNKSITREGVKEMEKLMIIGSFDQKVSSLSPTEWVNQHTKLANIISLMDTKNADNIRSAFDIILSLTR